MRRRSGKTRNLILMTVLAGSLVSSQIFKPAKPTLRERILEEFSLDPGPPPIPRDNPQSVQKVALGEALFFDPNLSSCGTIACATCHIPEQGFSDGLRISKGCGGAAGRRNSNTVYNTAYLTHLFWDGRARSLEEQAHGPIQDPAEMANTWDNVLKYLSTGEHPVTGQSFPDSARLYGKSFGEVFSGEISSATVSKALAAYQRTAISGNAPFDRWIEGDDSALSAAQKRGASVFFGRGQCSRCHSPPHFTDSDFHNVGVPSLRNQKPGKYPHNERICYGIPADVDPGRGEVLQSSCSEVGKFKTPTLRNVELSGPYMHNGRFGTLEEVLQHYWRVARGTTTPPAGTLDEVIDSVRLTDFGGHPDDLLVLAEFLKALTGSQLSSPDRGIAPPEEPR